MDDKTFLKDVSILQDLDEAELRAFAAIARPLQVPRGTSILKEGESGDTMYILEEGTVEVSKALTRIAGAEESPGRDKILSKLAASTHAVFGEVALFEQNTRTATVVALSECRLLEVGKSDFFQLAEQNPRLGYKITRNIAELLCSRLRKTNEDTMKLTTALSLALSR
jgi:CRP/FNR family cyclic AMP-dependent transcriptional regulator